MEDDQDLLDGLDDDTDTGSDSDSGDGDTGAPPAGKPNGGGDKGGDKRVNDLMGKWQAAEARAKRAEAALKAQKGGDPAGTEPGIPAEVRQWLDAAKQGAVERYYNSDPRFAEYGLDQSLFAGETPDAVKATTKRFRDLIDAVESKARSKVLDEFGLVPEHVGSAPQQPKDYRSMSDEEFNREVARYSGLSASL